MVSHVKPKYKRMLDGMKPGHEPWYLYILECADGSFYTGITKDLERRLAQHEQGKAARYTRTRRPVRLRYSEQCADRASALKREYKVKSMTRQQKQRLVDQADE